MTSKDSLGGIKENYRPLNISQTVFKNISIIEEATGSLKKHYNKKTTFELLTDILERIRSLFVF